MANAKWPIRALVIVITNILPEGPSMARNSIRISINQFTPALRVLGGFIFIQPSVMTGKKPYQHHPRQLLSLEVCHGPTAEASWEITQGKSMLSCSPMDRARSLTPMELPRLVFGGMECLSNFGGQMRRKRRWIIIIKRCRHRPQAAALIS